MATLLTTPAMDPALRARIQRAVSPRARARHNAKAIGVASPFASGPRSPRAWLFPIVVAAGLVAAGLTARRAEQRAVSDEKRALAAALEERRATLPAGHASFIARTSRWIGELAQDTSDEQGADRVAPEVRGKAALEAWLARPAVYVRVPAADTRDPRALAEATRASTKDAFLVCLLHPPASGSEHDRLAKVRGVYFDGAKVDDETANVRRLASAFVGLTAVGPAFEGGVAAADGMPALRKLRRDLEAAPTADAARAAAADLLIAVVDEPGVAKVELVDLASGTVLLRVRRRPEEAGTSPSATLHRAELAACSLALEVRRIVEP